MEHRMREWTMTQEAVEALLERACVGRVSTVGEDGYPYTTAIHFLWRNGKLYFHGLPRGEKIANLLRCPKVCFETDEFQGILRGEEDPCGADCAYESVIARGEAVLIEDLEERRGILQALVEKYTPEQAGQPMEEARVRGTAVVEITPGSLTGKYHR